MKNKNINSKLLVVALLVLTVSHVLASDIKENRNMKTVYFAGGCFWCMEPPFEELEGVSEVISGYTGGKVTNPSYQEVVGGTTGHYESIAVVYDETKISYEELLEVFWRQIDPTDGGGQFVDRGQQYATAIFYSNEEEKKVAEESKLALDNSDRFYRPIVTEIIPFDTFYVAENYHQDYYKKSKFRYKFYHAGSGRDQFLKSVWEE